MVLSVVTCPTCKQQFQVQTTLLHSGGQCACPHCRAVVAFGAAALPVANPLPSAQPRAQKKKTPNPWLIWSIAGFLLLGLAGVLPGLGILIGLAGLATSSVWLVRPGSRAVLDRVFLTSKTSRAGRFALAIVAFAWAGVVVVGSVGLTVENKREERRESERAAAQAEQSAVEREDESELVGQARDAIDAGDLNLAADHIEAARSVRGGSARVRAVASELENALHQRDVDSVPAKVVEIEGLNESENWDEATKACEWALEVDAEADGLKAACDKTKDGVRAGKIPGWIEEANAVASDKKRCAAPADISDAWSNLKKVTTTDPGRGAAEKAADKLEACRRKAEKEMSKAIREVMVGQREDYAENYETGLLDQGFSATVTARGKYKDKLKIKYVLLSKATVHNITKDGTFLDNLEKIGFKQVKFTDGFYESWTYDLEPEDEKGGGADVLEAMGLGEPLQLPE